MMTLIIHIQLFADLFTFVCLFIKFCVVHVYFCIFVSPLYQYVWLESNILSPSHSPSPSHPIPFYSILFYSILFYSILFYSILFYSILFYSIQEAIRWHQKFQNVKSGVCRTLETNSSLCLVTKYMYIGQHHIVFVFVAKSSISIGSKPITWTNIVKITTSAQRKLNAFRQYWHISIGKVGLFRIHRPWGLTSARYQ
jgi:hypothetical protein